MTAVTTSAATATRLAWVQAGGRFHFDHLVKELADRGRLAGGRTARRHRVPAPGVRTWRALAWARALHRFSPLERVHSSSLLWDARFDAIAARDFRRFLRGRAADSLLLHGFAAYSLETARLAREYGVPVVIDTGSTHIQVQERLVRLAYESIGEPPRSFPEVWVERQLAEYELADAVLVGSSFAARSFAGTGLEPKLRIARYGADTARFEAKLRYRSAGPLVVGFVGNVNPEKGFHLLAGAVRALGADLTLRVAGRVPAELGRWWRALRPLVAAHFPHLAGEDLVGFYQDLDVFVLPSCQDGFPLAALEAMACGTPVVVSTNNGVADIVEDGETGRIVPAFDEEALGQAIRWFADDRGRVEACGREAATRVAGQSWSSYADQVERVYEELDA